MVFLFCCYNNDGHKKDTVGSLLTTGQAGSILTEFTMKALIFFTYVMMILSFGTLVPVPLVVASSKKPRPKKRQSSPSTEEIEDRKPPSTVSSKKSTVRGRGSNINYGERCTSLELYFLQQKQITNKTSNCPRRDYWLEVVLKDSSKRLTSNVVVVGCNKGDDFISMMEAFSGNKRYNVNAWLKILNFYNNTVRFACGEAKRIQSPIQHVRPVQGYCLEPMPKNLLMLKNLSKLMKFDPKTVHIEGYAVSALPSRGFFPDAAVGNEQMGLDQSTSGKVTITDKVAVDITNLDTYFSLNKLGIVDFLSIDTEGHDGYVIIGMAQTLAAKKVRVFEFEYHKIGAWATMDLSLIISMIDIHGYDCWWQGNKGQLWRLTGCWLDSYGTSRDWSNVLCVNRLEVNIHSAIASYSKQFMSNATSTES